jgi:hypothetical protein
MGYEREALVMPTVDHRPRTRNVYRFEIEAIWGGLPLEDQQLRDIEQMLSVLLVEGHGFQSASTDTTRLRYPAAIACRA